MVPCFPFHSNFIIDTPPQTNSKQLAVALRVSDHWRHASVQKSEGEEWTPAGTKFAMRCRGASTTPDMRTAHSSGSSRSIVRPPCCCRRMSVTADEWASSQPSVGSVLSEPYARSDVCACIVVGSVSDLPNSTDTKNKPQHWRNYSAVRVTVRWFFFVHNFVKFHAENRTNPHSTDHVFWCLQVWQQHGGTHFDECKVMIVNSPFFVARVIRCSSSCTHIREQEYQRCVSAWLSPVVLWGLWTAYTTTSTTNDCYAVAAAAAAYINRAEHHR